LATPAIYTFRAKGFYHYFWQMKTISGFLNPIRLIPCSSICREVVVSVRTENPECSSLCIKSIP